MGVGDPDLAAMQLVVIAPVYGVSFHGGHIGAGVRLGHGEEAHFRPVDPARQVFFFLLVCAEAGHRQGGAKVLHVEGQAPGSRHLSDLLRHEGGFQKTHAVAPQLFRQGAGEKSQLPHFRHALLFELVVFLLLFYGGRDVFQGKPLGGLLNQSLFFCQFKKHIVSPLSRLRRREGWPQAAKSWLGRGGLTLLRRAHSMDRSRWSSSTLSPSFT